MPSLAPSFSTHTVGSTPGKSMKSTGVDADVSWYTASMSKGGCSTRSLPSTSLTSRIMPIVKRSGRSSRSRMSFSSIFVMSFFRSPGIGSVSGIGSLIHSAHSSGSPAMRSQRLSKALISSPRISDTAWTLFHAASLAQAWTSACTAMVSSGTSGWYRHLTIFGSQRFSSLMMRVVSSDSTDILSFSRSPCTMYVTSDLVTLLASSSHRFTSSASVMVSPVPSLRSSSSSSSAKSASRSKSEFHEKRCTVMALFAALRSFARKPPFSVLPSFLCSSMPFWNTTTNALRL
mmetsp:Transcript_19303/g.58393  ORF Transcript_19303/g.58393 Transcript_19303/m.58393 type:complete len:289 (+) Transcript_19303:635-1501(+)